MRTNCINCLKMKGTLQPVLPVGSRAVLFTCKASLHLNFYGKDKVFKKQPDKLMKGRHSWNIGACHSFDNADEFNGLPDPCLTCENVICENPKPENGMKNGKETNRNCGRIT